MEETGTLDWIQLILSLIDFYLSSSSLFPLTMKLFTLIHSDISTRILTGMKWEWNIPEYTKTNSLDHHTIITASHTC